ncbi:hypothetical protein N9501_08275 [Amylibacter sp.]|nr:hypothetical protein [Amylibacter sp.]
MPEYDIPSMVKAINIPFQKYKFTAKKTWVKNVDRTADFGQKTEQFLEYIPHPNFAVKVFRKIFEETFPNKNLDIIGEKYPRYWVLDLQSLLDNKSFDTKLLFIFRNPAAVQLSYQHRKNLSKNALDLWSFNGPYEGIIHWILGWHLFTTKFVNLQNALGVKYEEMSSDKFNEEIGALLQLENKGRLNLEASPKLKQNNLCDNSWWGFLSEIVHDWDDNGLKYLASKYDLYYFRKRYWHSIINQPKLLFFRGFWRLGITLLFIDKILKLEKLKHRYKFLSWTMRRVL